MACRRVIGIRVREEPVQYRVEARFVVEDAVAVGVHLALQLGEDVVGGPHRRQSLGAWPVGARQVVQQEFDQLTEEAPQQVEFGVLELAAELPPSPAKGPHQSARSSVAHNP